ncbi:MAG: hypothetical protein M3Y27_28905, partial [Acidobacteriota bacterium]|nr:hypothetical protein [Acidobacteriota bacterium]
MINICTAPDDYRPRNLPAFSGIEDEHEEYRDLLSEFECVTRGLIEDLAAALEAHDTVGVVFADYWLQSLRRLGDALLR